MKTAFITILILTSFAQVVIAHPADGYTPNELDEHYGTESYHTGPIEGIGDLTFTCPYPDSATLSPQEKYMIAGTSDGPDGYQLRGWISDIGQILSMFYNNEGYLPTVLSEKELGMLWKDHTPDEQWRIDLYKSPLTNEFPRLDAYHFSPGNIYAQVLTMNEMRVFSEGNPSLQSAWFEQRLSRPGTPEDGAEVAPAPAIYLRVYGHNDVIYEMVTMMWAVNGSGIHQ